MQCVVVSKCANLVRFHSGKEPKELFAAKDKIPKLESDLEHWITAHQLKDLLNILTTGWMGGDVNKIAKSSNGPALKGSSCHYLNADYISPN